MEKKDFWLKRMPGGNENCPDTKERNGVAHGCLSCTICLYCFLWLDEIKRPLERGRIINKEILSRAAALKHQALTKLLLVFSSMLFNESHLLFYAVFSFSASILDISASISARMWNSSRE